mmetsp:Transcript_23791/g.49380  ORF Transcript_23791/g.49380 Transcript_23791/m.49380 type:complete len:97 (+) Transcript_23791:2045-2335(+)
MQWMRLQGRLPGSPPSRPVVILWIKLCKGTRPLDGVRIQNALTKYLNGGPKTFVKGKCLLQCEKRYGRIQCIIQKGSRCVGSNTDADKDKPHFASA